LRPGKGTREGGDRQLRERYRRRREGAGGEKGRKKVGGECKQKSRRGVQRSKGTPGNAKCVTEILGRGDKNKEVGGDKV